MPTPLEPQDHVRQEADRLPGNRMMDEVHSSRNNCNVPDRCTNTAKDSLPNLEIFDDSQRNSTAADPGALNENSGPVSDGALDSQNGANSSFDAGAGTGSGSGFGTGSGSGMGSGAEGPSCTKADSVSNNGTDSGLNLKFNLDFNPAPQVTEGGSGGGSHGGHGGGGGQGPQGGQGG